MYSVKEMFYSLQGEGAHAGRPALFCRFTGCNLWSGREQDRASSVCQFCDTDFIGTDGQNGGKFASPEELIKAFKTLWPHYDQYGYIVFTGGEPALQLDQALVDACHQAGFEVAIETNGTKPLPTGIDWVCVSPKADAELVITQGDELKLVYPQVQVQAQPDQFEHLAFTHFYLQPCEDQTKLNNYTQATVAYCLAHPKWRLSLQTHKLLGID